MSIVETVNSQHDFKETLKRAMNVIVQLYEEAPHFIYELLQNAEDTQATRVEFHQFEDRLEVYHDGRPFTERNLLGLTDIGLSDKLPENGQIGKFGVGFKSVYTICRDAYVASEPKNWRGADKAKYPRFAAKISDYVNLEEFGGTAVPSGFTTLFVFPYAIDEKGKAFRGFRNMGELRTTIAQKLQSLGCSTLLFLHNIKEIRYRIEVSGLEKSGEYSLEVKPVTGTRFSLVQMKGRKEDSEAGKHREPPEQYLLFTRKFKTEGGERSLDVAFRVTTERNKAGKAELKFIKPENGRVSVYFPTGTVSGLNFVVQGPFSTTPNREQVLTNDPANETLVREVGALLHDAILELRNKKFVTPEFLNLMPFDKSAFKHLPFFAPLANVIKDMFLTERIIPGEFGGYLTKDEAVLGRGNEMVALFGDELLTKLINDVQCHGWVSTKIKQFCEFDGLFYFLKKDIGVDVREPEDLRDYFNVTTQFLSGRDNQWLIQFYKLYATLKTSFEEHSAGSNMLTAAIIKTTNGEFVPARRDDGTGRKFIFNVFRPVTSKSTDLPDNMVDPVLYKACREFFDEVLKLPAPSGVDLFVSEFVERYSSNGEIPEDQHIADVKALIGYLSAPGTNRDVQNLVFQHLKLYGRRGEQTYFRNPIQADYMFSQTSDGLSLTAYYAGVQHPPCFVDEAFYSAHGIKAADLLKLCVKDSIVLGAATTEGEDVKLGTWTTFGAFRYELMLDHLPEVLVAIQDNPQAEESRIKSKIILTALMDYADALVGKLRIGGIKVSDELSCRALAFVRNEKRVAMSFWKDWRGAWLYDKNGQLVAPGEISKDDLDETLYGPPLKNSNFYETLGFKHNAEEAIVAEVRDMPQSVKDRVFDEELKRRSQDPTTRQYIIDFFRSGGVSASVLANEDDETFPIHSVRDFGRLRQHMLEQLAFADPVRFEQRLRSVKVSSIATRAKVYLNSLYGLRSGKCACQLCHKPARTFECVELFLDNELELEPMHLCICRSCSPDYRKLRNDDEQMDKLRGKIDELSDDKIFSNAPVEIRLGQKRLWFTPLHIAEIKVLMDLLT